MRRIALLSAIAVLISSPIAAAEIEASSRVDSVTVYPDGATVTRVLRLDLPAGDSTVLLRDFPLTLDPSSLRVEGQGQAKLLIGSIDARPPRADRPPANPQLEARIEALKDERAALDDKIAAATARRKFAERFAESAPTKIGEKGEARPLAEWREAFAAIGEEVAAADSIVREVKLRQREIDRDLARLAPQVQANPPRKTEVRIDLAADGATPATLLVSYTVRGARWLPIYDARLDTGSAARPAALELVRRAEIVQNTGEDWDDVALAVSTVRTAKGGGVPELRPLIVRALDPSRPVLGSSALAPAPASRFQEGDAAVMEQGRARQAATERETQVETGGFQVMFRVPGRISVPANEAPKGFRITTASIAPELLVRAAPALDETAFLEASFKQAEDAPLLPGRISLYRDNIFVGRSQMALTSKDETVRLGFGPDDRIKIARATVRKVESKAGIISSSKVDEREYKITARNGHQTGIRIVIEDQLPVSEMAEVQVELLPGSTEPTERDVRDRRGVIAWSFEAKPGEVRDIKLGWRVRWPADKALVFEPRRS